MKRSEQAENFASLAAKAKEEKDYSSAAKYYGLLSMEDPFDSEAVFFDAFYRAAERGRETPIGLDVKTELSDVIDKTFRLLTKEEATAEEKWEKAEEIIDCFQWFCSEEKENEFEGKNRVQQLRNIGDLSKQMADRLDSLFPGKANKIVARFLKEYVDAYLDTATSAEGAEIDFGAIRQMEDWIATLDYQYKKRVAENESGKEYLLNQTAFDSRQRERRVTWYALIIFAAIAAVAIIAGLCGR